MYMKGSFPNLFLIIDYEIWLQDGADLNEDTTNPETMTISCTDGTTPITRTYSVPISDEVSSLNSAWPEPKIQT